MPAMDHPAYQEEYLHLQNTLRVIQEEQAIARAEREEEEKALSHARRFDPDGLPVREMLYTHAVQTEKNLRAAYRKPYFTRIDFTENRGAPQTHYIGKYGVLKSGTLETEVVDWRAPVANLYYSGQIGPLKYTSPEGEIEGELTLKRQFALEDSAILSIFDTDIVAQDAYLRDALNQTTGDRLREIVTTIQAEQNFVIRCPLDKNLVVQGVAGSGKTTIALHRIAYLLYRYQDRLRPDRMLILAPNPLFLNFISQVLPDLGVEQVRQTTFSRFVQTYLASLAPKLAQDTPVSQMLALPEEELKSRSEEMQIKGSIGFMRRLEKWLDEYEERFPLSEDLSFGPVKIYSASELRRFLLVDEKPFPLRRRLDELKKQLKLRVKGAVSQICDWYQRETDRRILALSTLGLDREQRTRRAEKLQESLRQRLDEVQKMGRAFPAEAIRRFPSTDPNHLYRAFWEDMENSEPALKEAARRTLEKRKWEREDLAGVTLIAMRVAELTRPDVRHIVIDEAQDFNAFEIALLRRICRSASFTIVGDLMQGIAGYRGIASWEEMTDGVFAGDCQIHELVTSYRNTVEIMGFASRVVRAMPVANLSEAKPVLRHGEEPILAKGGADEAAALAEKWHGEGMTSVAVIGRSRTALEALSRETGWAVLNPEDEQYPGGIVLAPADSVKGLEFDAVILLDGGGESYPARPLDAKLLYVCLTRALHKMAVFYPDRPSPLLAKSVPDAQRA